MIVVQEHSVLVERFTAAVGLDDAWHDQLRALERGEAFTTRLALAAPSNLIAFGDQARINDLCIVSTAERAMHQPQP